MEFEFEDGLKFAHDIGLRALEVGVCGLGSQPEYCDREKLVKDKGEIRRWLEAFERNDLEISAMIGHGAPLTPDKRAAAEYSRQFRQACEFMGMAGLTRMTLLSGLPEGAEGDTAPNWVAFAEWAYLRDTVEWQWEQRLLPYWREHSKIAADNGVTLCFEMHGGDMVHNPITLKRLHDELGPVAACNFDTSHMWYQGIDPIEALRVLGPLVSAHPCQGHADSRASCPGAGNVRHHLRRGSGQPILDLYDPGLGARRGILARVRRDASADRL